MATNTPTYDFTIAKQVMTETDKDRVLCCYINSTDMNAVNWEKAAADFGSASVASFKKMISNAFKKVKDAEAKVAAGGSIEPSPVKTGAGKKRKAGAEDEEEGRKESSPEKKKKGGRPKKGTVSSAEAQDAEADVTAEHEVKKEASEELE